MNFAKSFMYISIGVSVLSLTLLPLLQHLYTSTAKPVHSDIKNDVKHVNSNLTDDLETLKTHSNITSDDPTVLVDPEVDEEEIADLEAQLRKSQEALKKLRKETETRQNELLSKLEATTLERETLISIVEGLEAEKSALEKHLKGLRTELSDKQGKLAEKLQALTPQLDSLKTQIAKLEEEKTNTLQVNTDLKAQVDLLTQANQKSQEDLKVTQDKLTTLENQSAESQKAQEVQLAKIDELKQSLEKQLVDAQTKEKTLATAQQELEKSNGALAKLQTEHATLKKQSEEAIKNSEALKNAVKEKETAVTDLNKKLTDSAAQLEKVNADLKTAQTTLVAKDEELKKQTTFVTGLQAALNSLSEKISGSTQPLKDDLTLILNQTKSLESEINTLKKELAYNKKAAIEWEKSKSLILSLQGENASLKEQLAKLQPPPKKVEKEESNEDQGPLIEASVAAIDVKEGLAVIDKGLKDGVKKGMKFWVVRDGNPLARIEVRYLQQTFAGCTILSAGDLNSIKLRDKVQTHKPKTKKK